MEDARRARQKRSASECTKTSISAIFDAKTGSDVLPVTSTAEKDDFSHSARPIEPPCRKETSGDAGKDQMRVILNRDNQDDTRKHPLKPREKSRLLAARDEKPPFSAALDRKRGLFTHRLAPSAVAPPSPASPQPRVRAPSIAAPPRRRVRAPGIAAPPRSRVRASERASPSRPAGAW